MPALDLALGLRVTWRATDVLNVIVVEPCGQIAGYLMPGTYYKFCGYA